MIAAIRGATTCNENTATDIIEATEVLLREILTINELSPQDIISIIFTVSPDLNAAFPAKAARNLGLTDTALLCAQEIDVPGAIKKCIRVLLHVNKTSNQKAKFVYLGEAKKLRPDLQL